MWRCGLDLTIGTRCKDRGQLLWSKRTEAAIVDRTSRVVKVCSRIIYLNRLSPYVVTVLTSPINYKVADEICAAVNVDQ